MEISTGRNTLGSTGARELAESQRPLGLCLRPRTRSGMQRGLPTADSLPARSWCRLPGKVRCRAWPTWISTPGCGIAAPSACPRLAGWRVLLHVGAAAMTPGFGSTGRLAGTHPAATRHLAWTSPPACRAATMSCPSIARTRPACHGGRRQAVPDYYSRQCHYTRTTGLWQTVWLEAVPDSYWPTCG
jgi:hypothetical protein